LPRPSSVDKAVVDSLSNSAPSPYVLVGQSEYRRCVFVAVSEPCCPPVSYSVRLFKTPISGHYVQI